VISFVVPGKPVPKARARVMRGGWSFTPKKTLDYENLIKLVGISRRNALKVSISGGSFSIKVICYGARKNGDVDNYLKSYMDALQGVFWVNDCQIIDAHVLKVNCEKGKERTEVEIEAIS
jgi:crossover junction endodeoxyribonuclease RusA